MSLIEVLEYVAFTLNIAYVWFESKNNIICWPIGIIGSGVLTYIFLQDGLYSESVLMAFYILAGVYGWWSWSDKPNSSNKVIDDSGTQGASQIIVWPFKQHIPIILLSIVGAFALYFTFKGLPGVQKPLLDAFTTSFSLFATYVLAKRVLSHWFYWMVINAVTIVLYYQRGFEMLTIMAVIFFGMSIFGYFSWKKLYRNQPKLS